MRKYLILGFILLLAGVAVAGQIYTVDFGPSNAIGTYNAGGMRVFTPAVAPDSPTSYWNTAMTDRWDTAMSALWETTMDTEVP